MIDYQKDEYTYEVRRDPKSTIRDFDNAIMALVIFGIIGAACWFMEMQEVIVLAFLLPMLLLYIIFGNWETKHRCLTFNTATGEMSLRRLFRKTIDFHRDDITRLELRRPRALPVLGQLRIYLGKKYIQINVGKAKPDLQSKKPGGIDPAFGKLSNTAELLEFLDVWSCAETVLYDRHHKQNTRKYRL